MACMTQSTRWYYIRIRTRASSASMNQFLVLVIGALVPLASTAVNGPFLTVNYEQGSDHSLVFLNCNPATIITLIGSAPVLIQLMDSAEFRKRVPGGAAMPLTSSGSAAEQVDILDQTDLSITFRFSQSQEGYFSCQSPDGVYQSTEVGIAGNLGRGVSLRICTCVCMCAFRALCRDGSARPLNQKLF